MLSRDPSVQSIFRFERNFQVETVLEIKEQYATGEFSLQKRVQQFLSRIEEQKSLNAFVGLCGTEAMERAAAIDKKRASGKPLGKLAGLVLAVKDNICLMGHPTTCGSRILQNFIPPYNATAVQKILDEDGIIIGKTNLDEFAMGSSSEFSIFGPVRNPNNSDYVAGGSSGGSAVAVKANLADLALGSDTGGSVRQPASFCGVVGLKPSYGRVSRYGLVAYASSLDQIGVFGKSVRDVAFLTEIISGADPHDPTSAPVPVADFTQSPDQPPRRLRIGIPQEYFAEGLEPEVKNSVMNVINLLKQEGFPVRNIALPLTGYAIATYYIIATAEASSNLARYDGVRYGYRARGADNLREMYEKTRSEGFGTEVKRRIMLGTYVLSSGYYEAYYKKAQQVRRLIKDQFDDVFKKVDVLITPTAPTPPFKIGEKIEDPLQMYLSDVYTVQANLAGICAISLPGGKTKTGLPIGVQIMAGAFREDVLFQLGNYIEQLIHNYSKEK